MSYLLASRQSSSREEGENGRTEPPLPDTGIKPEENRSNVIPLPVVTPREIAPKAWQPPKEVIWMGQRQCVLALSEILLLRLSEPESANYCTDA